MKIQNLYCIGILFFLLNLSCKEGSTNNEQESTTVEIIPSNDIERMEPPHWWTDFKNPKLQVLIKHPNIGSYSPEVNHQSITLKKVHKADSPNYVFLDFEVSEKAKPGKFNIYFKKENEQDLIQTYELKSREKSAASFDGFDSSDVIYLITPDRFANADVSNDRFDNLLETKVDRSNDYARHGGDIKGITGHLDYIQNMGFTAVWPSPLLTNDMPSGSYHGYAITDYYQVDPRFGSLNDYKGLANELQFRNMKLVMDQVANHCGLEHWWMKDLPFNDWVNYQDHFETNRQQWNWETTKHSNHRRTTNQDPYASQKDHQEMSDGWFVSSMPDLNQRNPFMANYIIQNSIWWIETLHLGGIRQDTYPYPDKDFMSKWAGSIMTEYPNFSIVGEEWSYNPLLIAYWQDGHKNTDGYDSNLTSSMDFAMQQLIVEALNETESWDKGLVKMYEGLANDFAYASPKDIMVFPDNHDMSRIFTQLKGDITNAKMALSYLLMLPRIPQLYYGTEILMDDFDKPGDHGLIRTDFPGGWEGDAVNAFTGEGLSEDQKDMQDYIKILLNFRKESKAIHVGRTVHFAPENGIYLLARITDQEMIVHILNKNTEPIQLETSRFAELGLKGKTLKNVLTGETFVWDSQIDLNTKGSYIFTATL